MKKSVLLISILLMIALLISACAPAVNPDPSGDTGTTGSTESSNHSTGDDTQDKNGPSGDTGVTENTASSNQSTGDDTQDKNSPSNNTESSEPSADEGTQTTDDPNLQDATPPENSTEKVSLREPFTTSTALAYGGAPAHLVPFIYTDDTKDILPKVGLDVDTSACIVGRLYVINKNTNIVVPIGTDTVKDYATSKDHLYYTTDDTKIVQTDYTGSTFKTLYSAPQLYIYNLEVFGNILYFIEDYQRLFFLDTVNGNTQLILTESELLSAYLFNEDKLMLTKFDAEGGIYYNIATQERIILENQYQVNAIITGFTK